MLAGEFGQPPNLQTRVPWRKYRDVQLPLVGQKGSNLIDRSRTTVLDKRAKIDRLCYERHRPPLDAAATTLPQVTRGRYRRGL